jgi:hypothetical protein
MALHTGRSYCDHDICIGVPDLEQIRTMRKASDSVVIRFTASACPTGISR